MKLNSISGLTLLAADLKKTTEFYEALGFRIGKQDDKHVTCYVNWFSVDFIATAHAERPEHQEDVKASHRGAGVLVQIKVENADEFYQGVLAKGMKPDGEPQGTRSSATGRSFVLRDPDGYKLVLFEKK